MKFFIAIPIPLLILFAIFIGGLAEKDPVLSIPHDIENADVETKVRFGDKARKAQQYNLSTKYCAAGIDYEDFTVKMRSLNCMTWAYKALGDNEKALEYAHKKESFYAANDIPMSESSILELKELEQETQ
jgi:hypothetical protein